MLPLDKHSMRTDHSSFIHINSIFFSQTLMRALVLSTSGRKGAILALERRSRRKGKATPRVDGCCCSLVFPSRHNITRGRVSRSRGRHHWGWLGMELESWSPTRTKPHSWVVDALRLLALGWVRRGTSMVWSPIIFIFGLNFLVDSIK